MRRLRTLLLMLAVGTPLHAQGAMPHLPAWLAGCWQQRSGATIIDEQWLVPRGGTMLGAARTTRGDSLASYEFMRILTRGDSLVFAAQPSGQAPSEFPALRHGATDVTFQNLAHDFPQRVSYRAVGNDSLHARIEGTMGGRTRSVDFRYARMACGPRVRAQARRRG